MNPEVTFARSRKKVPWDPAKEALLYLAESAGVPIPYACAQGHCGTCTTQLISGEVEYPKPPEFRVRAGYCLPCIARPRTNVTLDA
jgi:ferredoxin